MEESQPKHPVLVWALTFHGEVTAMYCEDLAEAEELGRINVASRAWRTWDVFEEEETNSTEGRKFVASHDKSKKPPRPRILANWTPPAFARTRILANWTPPDPPAAPQPPTPPVAKEPLEGRKGASSHDKDKPKRTRRPRIIPD